MELAIIKERKRLKNIIYSEIGAQNRGIVLCFVCGLPVSREDSSLEHVIELARGGDDSRGNLSISHTKCNNMRGSEFQEELNSYRKQK